MKKPNRLSRAMMLVLLGCLLPCAARALVISEVCSNNVTAYKAPGGDYSDWIELYNPDDEALDLSDCYLSNDAEHPQLFRLEGYAIEPKGYLVLCADKRELPFKLSAAGCELVLSDASGAQRVSVPPLDCDESYSLQPDGAYQIAAPSALAQNAAGRDYEAPVYVAPPVFSVETGFYDAAFALELSGNANHTIYYTLDGSVPDAGALRYTGALQIQNRSSQKNQYSALTEIAFGAVSRPKQLLDKMTVVRAVAIDAQGNASRVVTNSYGVGIREICGELPLLSLVADPGDLFDEKSGIYMLGDTYYAWRAEKLAADPGFDASSLAPGACQANFNLHGRLYEIPVSVQWIDAAGETRLNQDLGLRIHGNYSRAQANKSFQLYARAEYGGGSLGYSFWPEDGNIDRLTLRNGGNDQLVMFRDAFAHDLLEPLGIPVSRSMPCVLFLNGEYWGLYNLRQTQDADYIAENCGVYADDVIMIKNHEIKEGYADERALYTGFIKTLGELDCSRAQDYARACELMDADNFIRYVAGELYVGCTDWFNYDNNISLWRTRTAGAQANADTRWRWIYQDLDHTSGWVDASPTPVQSLLYNDVFASLWPSPEFQEKFLNEVMDVANILCGEARVNALLDEYAARYEGGVEKKYLRFGEARSAQDFADAVADMRAFYDGRAQSLAAQLIEALSLDKRVCRLGFKVSSGLAPEITVNANAIALADGRWSGVYLSECPISIAAGELAGWVFEGWYENGKLLSGEREICVELSADRTLTPVYRQRTSCVILNAARPAVAGDAACRLGTDLDADAPELAADEGLCLSADESGVTVAPDSKWRKRAGVTLSFGTRGYEALRLRAELALGDDAPRKWRLLYSLDGAQYTELDGAAEPLEAGAACLSVELPDALSNQEKVYLRLESEKKASGDDCALSLSALELYGEAQSAARLRLEDCLDACDQALGEEFERPDAQALDAMSEDEAEHMADALYARLAQRLVDDSVRAVSAADVAGMPALEGAQGRLCFEITDEACIYASQISVAVDWSGKAYLYRLSAQDLDFEGALDVADGRVALAASAGRYLLLDAPVETLRYGVRFDDAPIDDALLQSAFAGQAPGGHLWLKLELHTRYQRELSFELPARSGFSGVPYLYALNGSALEELERPARDEASGRLSVSGLESGRYLLLDKPLDWYRQYELLREEAAQAPAPEARLSKKALAAIAAAGAAIALGLVLILRRRRARAKREAGRTRKT